MGARTKKSRKGLFIGGASGLFSGRALPIVPAAAVAGFATLKGASPDVDPARIAPVERGTIVKSVVATGKVEPITKVEIKSKANGIIKVMHVNIDSAVNEGDVLAALDKEQ